MVNKKGLVVFTGKTPSTVTLKTSAGYFQKEDYEVKFTIDGYEEKTYPIRVTMNGWYFGNIILGGALGMLVVDPLTDAMWKITPTQRMITATLTASSSMNKPVLQILHLYDIPVDERKNLVLLK